MKTQVNLATLGEKLLISRRAGAREPEQTESIVIVHKSAEIVKAISLRHGLPVQLCCGVRVDDYDKFYNASNSLVGCCIRGIIIDNWVSSFFRQYPQGTVVEIGAGLNTRFEPLDKVKARWFQLDLPDVIQLKLEFFTQSSRRQFMAASVSDNDWVERIKQTSIPPYMFVAEELLMYFS